MQLSRIRLKDGYVLREMAGEFHIFSEEDKMNGSLVTMPSLNETGIFLWVKLESGMEGEKLIHALMEKSQSDYEDAESDVEEFLAKLIHSGVVECS